MTQAGISEMVGAGWKNRLRVTDFATHTQRGRGGHHLLLISSLSASFSDSIYLLHVLCLGSTAHAAAQLPAAQA